jgi:hypothetical protein
VKEATRDPDDPFGDGTVFYLEIRVRRNGAMSVAGHINHVAYACQVLDAAKQTVKGYAERRKMAQGDPIIVPSYDTPWDRKVQ